MIGVGRVQPYEVPTVERQHGPAVGHRESEHLLVRPCLICPPGFLDREHVVAKTL